MTGSKVFLVGDSYLGSMDKSDLQGGVATSRNTCHDGVVSDLKSMTAYCFDVGGSNFTKLTQLDQSTGAVPASPTVITLSSPIPVSGGEIYSGYGRVVYRNGTTRRVYDVDLPSGTVYDRGTVTVTRMDTEQYATGLSNTAWGVAEFFDSELWLTVAGPSYPVSKITRYRVSDGTTQVVADAGALRFSDLASFTVDPTNQRWYFHYEGNSSAVNFGYDETLGFADAVITTTPAVSVVPSSTLTNANTLSYAVTFGEAVTDLTISDFTLGGTSAGWSITGLTANSSTSYTLNLDQAGSSSGTVTMSLAANSVYWTAGAMTIPDSPAVASTVTVDHDPPTATVASSPASPAAGMSLTFGLTFSESVSGIAAADFTNIGTAAGCVFTPSAASGSSVNVVVTQCEEGTLQLRLAANGVTDAAGNTGPTANVASPSITLAASALTVTAASQNVNYGGTWTDSYSQSGLLGGDSLTVTYSYSGTTTLGTPYGPSATKPTAGGSYSIIPAVGYGAGNTNRYALVRNNGTLVISRVAQSVLTVTSTSATYGQNLSLTTSGGSGTGAVSWAKVSGACTLAGSVIIPDDAGSSCVVKATKAADDNYLSVDSANTSITTNMANQATLTVTSTSATYGQSLPLTTSGGSGTGAVNWTKISGTCTLSGSAIMPGDVGTSCVVKATKASDTNYNSASSANTSISTGKGSQTGFTVSNATSFTTGTSLSLTATGGQSGGNISWSLTSGQCTLTGTNLTASRGGISCVVEATRAGDSNYFAVSDSATITVNKIAQVLTFRSTPPSSANPGGTYTVSVDSDAFLAPVIAIANTSSSVCSISAGVVTFNTVGTCLVSASQAGNDTYAAGAASQSITVTALAAAAPQTSAPAVVAPVSPPSSVDVPQTVAPAATTTTIPPKAASGVTTTVPRPVVTTTTSTTTTVPVRQDPGAPNAGADGEYPELKAGEMSVLVRGRSVKVKKDTTGGRLTLTLPNNVVLRIGSTDPTAKTARLNADGELVVNRGETIEVSAEGFIAGTTYTVFMFSDPVELGRGVVSADGTVSGVLDVPTDVKTGGHTLQMNGVGDGDEVVSVSVGFEVLERSDNTLAAVLAISAAILLALLGGRPVWRRRRRSA